MRANVRGLSVVINLALYSFVSVNRLPLMAAVLFFAFLCYMKRQASGSHIAFRYLKAILQYIVFGVNFAVLGVVTYCGGFLVALVKSVESGLPFV